MSRPRLLDLFCCAGGAAMGYHQAGFEVVGVDIDAQPHYPFEFVQADALSVLRGMVDYPTFSGEMWRPGYFAAVHASPPCQRYTRAQVLKDRAHPDLVGPTRDLLVATGLPWVMENVIGAPLENALTLCGTEFGLHVAAPGRGTFELRRHRLFEVNWPVWGAGGCRHRYRAISVFGHGGPRSEDGEAASRSSYQGTIQERREVMGIDWMNRDELSEAIPPAMTEHIGRQLVDQLPAVGRAA